MALSPSGLDFLVSFLFNFGVCIAFFLGFLLFRRRLNYFYAPNVPKESPSSEGAELTNGPDATVPHGALAWVRPAISTPLEWFKEHRGLEAMLYLKFLRACFSLFAFTTVYSLVVLFPTNASGTNKDRLPSDPLFVQGLDVISMANVRFGSGLLWVHGASVLVLTLIVLAGTYRHYVAYAKLRHAYLTQGSVFNRSVLVRDASFKHEFEPAPTVVKAEILKRRVEGRFPHSVSAVSLPRHDETLLKLRKTEAKLQSQLRRAIQKQDKQDKPVTHRTGFLGLFGPRVESIPTITDALAKLRPEIVAQQAVLAPPLAGVGLVTFQSRDQALAVLACRRLIGRPFDPLALLETAGKSVLTVAERAAQSAGQAVTSAAGKVQLTFTKMGKDAGGPKAEADADKAGADEDPSQPLLSADDDMSKKAAAGVGSATLPASASASSSSSSSSSSPAKPDDAPVVDVDGALKELPSWEPTISFEPGPERHDIYWEYLHVRDAVKARNRTISILVIIVLLFFWAIPTALVQGLGNLRELAQNPWFDWLNPLLDALGPTIEGLLNSYLPSLLLVLLMSLVVPILTALTEREGLAAHSIVGKTVLDRFFAFLVINVFLVTVVAGSIFTDIQAIIRGETTLRDLLAQTIPNQGAFFIEYIMVKFSFVTMELLRPDTFALLMFKKAIVSDAADKPSRLKYHSRYAWDLLVVVISLTYSVMFPLISIFAALYFALAMLVYRYNLIYVHEPMPWSGGQLWSRTFRNIVFGLLIFQITMIGVLSLNGSGASGLAALAFFITCFAGYRIAKVAETVRKLGYVPQGQGLIPGQAFDFMNIVLSDAESESLLGVSYGTRAPVVPRAPRTTDETDQTYYREPALEPPRPILSIDELEPRVNVVNGTSDHSSAAEHVV